MSDAGLSIASSGHPLRTRRADLLLAAGALGLSAAVIQLALLRELLAAFSGNELTLGTGLCCWMLLTAAGTWLGSLPRPILNPLAWIGAGTIAIALCAIVQLLAIRAGRDVLFLRGVAAGPLGTTLACLAALGPFCLGSGALLTFASRAVADENDSAAIGRVYAADGLGGIVGAAAFTYGLSPHFDHAAALCWVVAFLGVSGAWIAAKHKAHAVLLVAILGALGAAGVAMTDRLDRMSSQWQHHGAIVFRATSPYGRVVVTRDAGQLTFFENGAPVIYSANAAAVEELVHYSLAQRPATRGVLLIGGGIAGCAREILRYPQIERVTCVELDPALVAAGRQLRPEAVADARIELVTDDGRKFLRNSRRRFDAILIALPDPTTIQLNRYFTVEFFRRAHRSLAPGGVLCFAAGQYENYVSPELAALISSARATLRAVFAQVVVFPGSRVYFVGSDSPLTRDIAAALERQGLRPSLVNRNYLDAMLTPDRLADVDRAAADDGTINRDFHPILYLLKVRLWISQFRFPTLGFIAGLAAVLLASLVGLSPVSRMVFAAGFASSTLEIILMVAFQALYGSVYRQVGAVVATFMLGLSAGAFLGAARTAPAKVKPVRVLAVAIAGLALIVAQVLPQVGRLDDWGAGSVGPVVILALNVMLGALIGGQFAYAAAARPEQIRRIAPRYLSADLTGAALGALAVSTLLLPLWGVGRVCIAIAALNVVCVAVSFGRQGHA
jgi:spermidine synthase